MSYEIVMPQLGLTMTEGSVSTWFKQPGEWVKKGEILLVIQTDKVDIEVESFGSGYLSQILVENGCLVPVGTVLATLEETAPAVASPPATDARAARIKASPRARKLAQELGVDLSRIQPSGSRITEDDVRRFHQQSDTTTTVARKVAARRLTKSFQSAPHFYLGVEANASALVSLREELNAQKAGGVSITYTDFLLKALAEALVHHPGVNAYWNGDQVVARNEVNIACAVQTDQGLVAPVVRHVNRLDLPSLAEKRRELVARSRSHTLRVEDMEGGSATLSNLGSFGVDWFQAILNPPQSVILAAGRIASRPVVVENQLRVQPTIHLNLSADHRVLDGVAAAEFLVFIQRAIERAYPLAAMGQAMALGEG